jgi:hypothetical protein
MVMMSGEPVKDLEGYGGLFQYIILLFDCKSKKKK